MRVAAGLLISTILVALVFADVVRGGEPFTFEISDEETEYAGGVADDITVTVTITEDPFNPDYPQETDGFQMGISFDDEAISIVQPDSDSDIIVGILADFDDGDGPAFFSLDFDPANGPGLTVGCVFDAFGGGTIAFEIPEDVFELTIEALPGFLAGGDLTTDLEFVDTLGVPGHLNQVVVDGVAQFPDMKTGTLTYVGLDSTFVRGDLDGDGKVGMMDAFKLILALFAEGDEITCNAAADLTEDGELTTDDILYILEYAYIEGPAPSSPFPKCGTGKGSCSIYEYCH